MSELNEVEYILILLRFLAEICSMVYFADYIAEGSRMTWKRLVITMAFLAAIIIPIDFYIKFSLLPVLALAALTATISMISHRNIADTLGRIMFSMVVTYIPEIIAVWIAIAAGIDTSSYIMLVVMVIIPAALIVCGVITDRNTGFGKIRLFVNDHREIIVIISVSISIPLVILGHQFLWDDIMFWKGYAGTATLVAVYLVIGIYLIKTFFDFQRNRNEREISNEYNQYLSTLLEEMNRRDHEYKNQLNAIIGMAESGRKDASREIVAFADEIIVQNAKRKSTGNVISDNTVVAAYILRMGREAEEKEISFDYHIAKPLPPYRLSQAELVELIANLLNNAFEAVSRFEKENRNVSLCMAEHNIDVINYVGEDFDPELLAKIYDSGFSTKGKNRGYGMTNVMAICEKYGIHMDAHLKGAYLEIRLEM